ncbi:putative transcription regulator Homeodomain-LIKE family [Helianthus annuus]|nr:putative transcription regulator Homeodomain-LIKE family [Helianthus annuus]
MNVGDTSWRGTATIIAGVRYTPEEVEALERLYHDCPKLNSHRTQQLIRECLILSNIIELKQINCVVY